MAEIVGTVENDIPGAEEICRNALNLAQQQGARSWELRPAVDLALLLANGNRQDEALRLVEGVGGLETLVLMVEPERLAQLRAAIPSSGRSVVGF